VVALFGGAACAVPAIMSARTIPNPRERLLTILVTPLMSCSARLPVYALLIALVIPEGSLLGLISYKGTVMLGLYALGTAMALLSALVISRFMPTDVNGSHFIMEMPPYALPHWRNVAVNVWGKLRSFVVNAGKWIVAISVLLWLGSSVGMPGRFAAIDAEVAAQVEAGVWTADEAEGHRAALRLEHSFVGMLGRGIEPVVAPLGYDWRIGIAIVTSFAAREVFVGTMGTIFSLGSQGTEGGIRGQMAALTAPDGSPLYGLPFGLSLMVFYAFAMQCMSTLAVTRSETGTWRWPLLQFVYMGVLAYGAAFVTYRLAQAIFA
jgi:ferrous iron transport protein B